MNLTDFTIETRGYLCKPWKFTDRKLVAASDGRILLARSLSAKDKYEEAPADVRDKFALFIDAVHGPQTIKVSMSKLARWAGPLQTDEDNWPLMIPGYFMGVIFNRMQFSRAFKLVSDERFTVSILPFTTGQAAFLTGKKWRIILMACTEGVLQRNDLKENQPVRKFAYA